MNRIVNAKLKVIWTGIRICHKARNGLRAYNRFAARNALPVLLTAGVMGIAAALVHARAAIWRLFAAEMFAGAIGVVLVQRHTAKAARRQRDCACSHEEESA